MTRFNMGCGEDIREGYTNVDIRKTHPAVHLADLSTLPWPFADGCAEEILMLDFLEHFPYRQTAGILSECWRMLAPEGELVVQVPDGRHLAKAFAQIDDYLCNRCGYTIADRVVGRCEQCGQSLSDISQAAMMRLFGGQDYVGNFHQTAFTEVSLIVKARDAGLKIVDFEEVDHQYKNWNMKARFRKADPWAT